MTQLAGQSREWAVLAINTGTTVSILHHQRVLDVTASGSPVDIALPAGGNLPDGFTIRIQRNAASDSNVTISGGATATLTASDTSREYQASATAWNLWSSGGSGGSISASSVTVTPTGGISSTNAQAALAELDSEKEVAGAAATVQGNLNTHTGLTTTAHGGIVASSDSRLTDARTPLSHTHGNITNAGAIGSTADLPVKTTTSGVLTTGAFGTGAGTFCQGNDSRLSDSRTPTTHATSHKSGGGDSIKLDELAAPTDITTLNASTTAHGLLPKLSNVATEYLNGQGAWATPSSGAGEWWGRISNATAIEITSAATATIDRFHYISGTASAYDITLPAASSNSGKVLGFVVRHVSDAPYQYRLDAGAGVEIAGRNRYLTLVHTNIALLVSDGTDWRSLVLCLDTPWYSAGAIPITAVTTNPTKDGSPVTDEQLWRRVGDSCEVNATYNQTSAGTAGSGLYRFGLPIGTIDFAKLADSPGAAATYATLGSGRTAGTSDANVAVVAPSSGDYVHLINAATTVSNADYPLSSASRKYAFRYTYPVTNW
jgi:hypothetical protein